jgi:hypothetical protein
MRPGVYLSAALIAGVALAGALAWSQVVPPTPPGPTQATTALRTVLVVRPGQTTTSPLVRARECRTGSACENGAGGVPASRTPTSMPPAVATTATVLTDTNCMPDHAGISHCHNALRLADGSTITVRHDHDMRRDPCFTPGETVRVVSMGET